MANISFSFCPLGCERESVEATCYNSQRKHLIVRQLVDPLTLRHRNMKTEVSFWKCIKCFLCPVHQRNCLKTKQLQVLLVIVDGARKASGIENYTDSSASWIDHIHIKFEGLYLIKKHRNNLLFSNYKLGGWCFKLNLLSHCFDLKDLNVNKHFETFCSPCNLLIWPNVPNVVYALRSACTQQRLKAIHSKMNENCTFAINCSE